MASKVFDKLITLPTVVLGAIAESYAAIKLFPEHVPQGNIITSVFLPLLAVNFAFYAIFWGLINPYVFSPIRHFPEPKALFPRLAYFGGLLRRPPGQHFLEWSEATPNDGLLLLRSPFQTSRLLVTKPKALADLFVAHAYDFIKPKKVADFLRKVLGDGLIIVEGDVHKFQRKHAMPAFSFRHIKDLYPMMFRKSIALTEAVRANLAEQPQTDAKQLSGKTEINSWANKATLDIIGIAGMGKELNVLKNSDNPLVHNYEILLEPTAEKLLFFMMSSFLSMEFVKRLPWKLNQVFENCTTTLARVCADNVREKREAIKSGGDDHFDVLSLLIKSNDFSDSQLVDQLLTFLAAGHETTSSALTWVTYLLAIHPDIQQRLREEIREALPSNPLDDPSIDLAGILEKLPLLNGVCQETLRLYPTVPITMRIAIRDTVLIDKPIPKGTEIIVSPWAVNRSRELWGEDAGSFRPDRWIDNGKPNNNGGADSNYSLLTFLHGPRSCIGQGFARAELRCLVAAFIRSFEWDLNMKEEDIMPAGVITIKPEKGMHIKLRALDTW